MLIQNYKQIYDSIHGYIGVSNIAIMIIDTIEFQRLRKLKQLGSCCYVFQNAIHTRYEHSIGTYFLAGKILKCISANTNTIDIYQYLSEIHALKSYFNTTYGEKIFIIDEFIIELIKIAALCHDLGHGPFSHVFDDFFLPYVKKKSSPNDHHEVRSCLLLEKIIKSNKKLSKFIGNNEIQFMKNIINPEKHHTGFIYQIVSNSLNGLDVDKFDYIARDSYVTGIQSKFNCQRLIDHVRIIDNNICYPEQSIGDIIELYSTRYKLHKTVYTHKSVISAQYMIIEIFKYLDKIINLSDSVNDMDKFCKMTDEYILTCTITLLQPFIVLPKQQIYAISRAETILTKLNAHQIYPHVITYVNDTKLDINRKQFVSGVNSDILIYRNTIGFVSGNKKNPLDNIFVFKTKDLYKSEILTCRIIDVNEYSYLIPKNHQEHIIMVFYKHKNHKIISALQTEFNQIVKSINVINQPINKPLTIECNKTNNTNELVEDDNTIKVTHNDQIKLKNKEKPNFYVKSRKSKNKINIFDDLVEQLTYSDKCLDSSEFSSLTTDDDNK